LPQKFHDVHVERAHNFAYLFHVCHVVGHTKAEKFFMTSIEVVPGTGFKSPCMSCMWTLKVSQKFHDIHVRGSVKVKRF